MNLVHADAGPPGPALRDTNASPTPYPRAQADMLAAQLASACNALWTANLSLMMAFMHTRAPAHRLLMARRIARNFATLQEQDCFAAASRASFARLSRRWNAKADRLAREEQRPRGGIALLLPNLFNR